VGDEEQGRAVLTHPEPTPIEAHFGPLRQCTRALHAYLRWRYQNARHPNILAAQRRERALIRSERGLRWLGMPLPIAA
jgi:hypothetical protein